MRKIFLASLFLLSPFLFFGCEEQEPGCPDGTCPIVAEPVSPPVVPPAPPEFRYKNYLRATCRVSSGGSGACFKVDDDYVYILTNHHVVGSGKNFRVEFWLDGRITGKYSARVIKVLKVDAAVLVVPVGDFKVDEIPVAIPLSSTAPKVGDTIVSVGCAGLSWYTLFEGRVTGFSGMGRYNGGKQSINFVPPPKGGRSGSGIYMDGEIVGLLWGSDGDNGYAVNCEDLSELLDSPSPDKPDCPECPQKERIK